MRTGRKPNQPLYVLPYGIAVIGEYAPSGANRYWRVRIRPHPFFSNVKVVSNGIGVRRSRVLLAAQLGRALTPQEHAHHGNEDRHNDAIDNLKLLPADEHMRHHKTSFSHSADSRAKTSASLTRAYAEGRHHKFPIIKRDELGRITS